MMSSHSHSELLRYKIDLMSGPRAAAYHALWEHPRLKELFPWAMVRTYLISNASVPLMRVAVSRAEEMADDDPVAAGMISYLNEHIPEEIGHDEQFLEDIEALGISKEEARAQVPWPSLAALIGMQYYWILHRHPIAFVGYAATIEGNPVPLDFIEEIKKQTGLSEAGFRTLEWHSRHDAEHSAELDKALDALPLTPEQSSLIGVNIANTHQLLAQSVHEMIASFEEKTGHTVQ